MGKPLRVLIVEDSSDDTELLLLELRRGGYDPLYERVETASAMKIVLERQAWDVVISDHSMPYFSAIGALTQLHLSRLDLPFIIVSGVIGEEIAVAAMKAGAHDYIMKGNLARLVPAIERELKDAEERRKRKQAEAEKIKLREQLLHAQRLESVGKLSGAIAHDFNNILQGIIGFAEMVQKKIKDEKPLKDYVQRILTTAEKGIHLTHGLLTFGRKQPNDPKPINLNTIIQWSESLLSRLIRKDIKFETVLTHKDCTVMADSTQMEQVMMNLATNASDAMPDGGRLTISTDVVELDDESIKAHGFDTTGKYAFVSVSDTGIGMDEETKKKIFEPFFTTKKHGEGTGLGLSIVYGIIKQHQGYIQVDSAPGKGTTFKIYLPIIETTVEEDTSPALSTPVNGTETILIAEDEEDIRKRFKTAFEESGYKVIAAIDGDDALDKFTKNKDKIIMLVLDLIMPKKNGKEVYDEIRKIRTDIKTLFMSGYSHEIIDKKIPTLEGFHFVSKPLSSAGILKKVREVLDM